MFRSLAALTDSTEVIRMRAYTVPRPSISLDAFLVVLHALRDLVQTVVRPLPAALFEPELRLNMDAIPRLSPVPEKPLALHKFLIVGYWFSLTPHLRLSLVSREVLVPAAPWPLVHSRSGRRGGGPQIRGPLLHGYFLPASLLKQYLTQCVSSLVVNLAAHRTRHVSR